MSKFKLGYLKPKNTVWVTIDRVHVPESNPLPVRIEVRCSGRINAEYTSAIIKLGKEREQQGAAETANALDASDARSLKLFAKHVVVSWENVCDEKMAPIPFSAQDAEEMLLDIAIEQKSPDVLVPLLARAGDTNSFRNTPAGDPETLGKR